MELMRCDKGHFYDADEFVACPHCAVGASDGNKTIKVDHPLERYESYEWTDEPFIFISYAHADAEKVKPYFDILEKNHFRYWYDEGLPSGKDFYEQICSKIKSSIQFVVFLSENSQKSENVKDEIHIAYKYRKNILVVYIEQIPNLNPGLELALDRKQNLLAYKYKEADIEKKFYKELAKDALDHNTVWDESLEEIPTVDVTLFPEYKNFKLCAKSKMSETISAENIKTGCKVVIKKINFEDSQTGIYLKKCFENEKKALKICKCPFLPQLINYFEKDNSAYIVETFLYGESPKMQNGYSEEFVVHLGIKVVEILKYLYYYGVVHCDIKPNNILINVFGDAYLVDFGSCRFPREDDAEEESSGTIGFAAPEQADSTKNIDFRTDIYALGRTMLSLLVGDKISSKNALGDASDDANMTVALNQSEVKIQYITMDLNDYDRSATPMLNNIINKMIDPQKENRYNNLDVLLNDLKKAQEIIREKFNRNKEGVGNVGSQDLVW